MHHFDYIKHVPFSKKRMADLILDVASYKDFLPWIIESKVNNKGENYFDGTLLFCYKGIQKEYTSRVIFEDKENDYLVKIMALDGPFRILKSIWKISAIGEKECTLHFSIDIDFSNIIYEKLFLIFFSNLAKKTISAFEKRAYKLYS